VINEDRAAHGRPGGSSADGSGARADRRGQASTDSLRAITTGAAGRARPAAPAAEPGQAYGPDDPAYGPPGPEWYNRDQTHDRDPAAAGREPSVTEPAGPTARAGPAGPAETVRSAAPPSTAAQSETRAPLRTGPAEENPHVVRGPFEPLVEAGGPTARPSEPEAADDEFPGLADDGPVGSADAALERLKALHLTAAAVEPQSLDAHFDQLLARQRKLISEYLGQADGPVAPAVAVAVAGDGDGDGDGSLAGFGDDYQTAR
jgi:hypothetical protein